MCHWTHTLEPYNDLSVKTAPVGYMAKLGATGLGVYKHQILLAVVLALPQSWCSERSPHTLPVNEASPANTSSSCEHVISSSMARVPSPKFNFHAYLSSLALLYANTVLSPTQAPTVLFG